MDKRALCKAVLMLSGCVKALTELERELLAKTLIPVLQLCWPRVCRILQSFAGDESLVVIVCNFFVRCVKALNLYMVCPLRAKECSVIFSRR